MAGIAWEDEKKKVNTSTYYTKSQTLEIETLGGTPGYDMICQTRGEMNPLSDC